MTNQRISHKFFRILTVVVLAALALGAISPASAATTHTVIGVGANYSGQTSIPSGLTDAVAIAAGADHSLALKGDGTVIAWGNNDHGQATIPSGLSDVVAIAAGSDYNLALKGDGTVVGWGDNSYGQATIPSGLSDVVAIAAGMCHSMALKADGTVIGWGYDGYGFLDIPSGLADVVAIAAGFDHSLALKGDGTVVAWGFNDALQLSVPSGLVDVVAIAAGGFHSLALKSDGTVVSWGGYLQYPREAPAGLTDVVAIDAGYYHSLALKSDGTVVGWGSWLEDPGTIPSDLNVVAIAAGGFHSLAIVSADLPANTAPTANPGGPYLGAVNTSIAFDGSLSSDPESDPLTYTWDFGDTPTGTEAMPTHTYTAAGVYNVCLTVNDGSLDSAPACTLAVVYDPSAGFVTGGGWINSPAGAYLANPSLTGKAHFGFIAKYQKGASLPSGNTAFAFDVAGLSFASQSYDWLVVNQGGANAQFKGSGTVNGALDPTGQAYQFMLWAEDGASTGSADTFRIKIWSEAGGAENVVYDNGVAQAIGAGNIVVHTSK